METLRVAYESDLSDFQALRHDFIRRNGAQNNVPEQLLLQHHIRLAVFLQPPKLAVL